jgi:NADPH-dependent curcumin reductase CurA
MSIDNLTRSGQKDGFLYLLSEVGNSLEAYGNFWEITTPTEQVKREIVFEGLENTSNATRSLFNGENFGKRPVDF